MLPDPTTTAARNSVTGTPASRRRRAGLLPRAQVAGELGGGVSEAAEVHEAADARPGGGAAEGPRRGNVAFAIALAPGHGVHEVVGDAHPGQRRLERLGMQHVPA